MQHDALHNSAATNGATLQPPTLLRHYLEILLENRGFIGKIVLAATLVVALVVFLLPKTYSAKVVLMPPEDPSKQNLLLQAVAGSSGLSGLIGGSTTTDVLVEILKSRTVADSLSVALGLAEFLLDADDAHKHQREQQEKIATALSDATRITSSKQGFITIEVRLSTPAFSFSQADEDSVKHRVVRLANGYADMLDRTNRRLANLKSLYNARYFSEQMQQAKRDLDSAYSNLERFQKSHKAVAISEQMKLQLEAASKLKASMIAEEINLDLLLRDRQPNDMTVIESRNRLNEVRSKYNEVALGKSDKFAMGFEEMPALAREYANYYREVRIHEEVYALLKQLYFKERVQGYRDTPTVVVLDDARLPIQRTSPKRLTTMLLSVPISFLAAVSLVFFMRFLRRSQQDESYQRLWTLLNQTFSFARKPPTTPA